MVSVKAMIIIPYVEELSFSFPPRFASRIWAGGEQLSLHI